MSLSTPAQRSAVAPPGRNPRAEMRSAGIPVSFSSELAACRRALVRSLLEACHWLPLPSQ